MAGYRIVAIDAAGNEIKQEMEARDEAEANQLIRSLGYFPTLVTLVDKKEETMSWKKFKIMVNVVFFGMISVFVCLCCGGLFYLVEGGEIDDERYEEIKIWNQACPALKPFVAERLADSQISLYEYVAISTEYKRLKKQSFIENLKQ